MSIRIFVNNLLEGKDFTHDVLTAMARKAIESEHSQERETFHKKFKSITGKEPKSFLTQTTKLKPSSRSSTPEWAWAGHSGGASPGHDIHTKNYRDLNFIKKTMWELSGKSKEEHTVYQFDGTYFRNIYTSYGNKKIYPDMANAMLTWGNVGNPYHTKAIFISPRGSKDLHLVWANGKHMTPHSKVTHDSFNSNPANDQEFTKNLSSWIDKQTK